MKIPVTVPRGYVHCAKCGKFYPLRKPHGCKATQPRKDASNAGH
jgi:hypothetical protein